MACPQAIQREEMVVPEKQKECEHDVNSLQGKLTSKLKWFKNVYL